MCKRREVEGIVMMLRLSKLVHHGSLELLKVEIRQESRVKVTFNAMPFSFCRMVRTARMIH